MSSITYEAVIGLEVHARLRTATKIFSTAPVAFGARPNSLVSAGDAALPGTLPVLNRHAVELAVRAGLALDCRIQRRSIFDRKNYFYPDLPTGYQISQNDFPICLGGKLSFDVDGEEMTVPLTRIHMEQDAGKSSHEGDDPYSRIDLNRAGTPLIEIVTEPALQTPEQAAEFFRELRSVLVAIGANDGNMAEGSLRCDANVSIRPKGRTTLGTRAEIKNLNSFRFLRDAVTYEIERQIEVIEAGGTLVQETRLWNPQEKKTFSMRTKEDGEDYRYMPDPDIPPLVIDDAWLEAIRQRLPELPSAQRARLRSTYGLSAYDAGVLVDGTGYVALFDDIVKQDVEPKLIANLIGGAVAAAINEHRLAWNEESTRFVSSEGVVLEGGRLAALLKLQAAKTISATAVRTVFEEMLTHDDSADAIVERLGLKQVQDASALDAWIDQAIEQNASAAAAVRAGKNKAIGALLGAVMRASGGKANPGKVRQRLMERLAEND